MKKAIIGIITCLTGIIIVLAIVFLGPENHEPYLPSPDTTPIPVPAPVPTPAITLPPETAPAEEKGPVFTPAFKIHENGVVCVGGDTEPIKLINNTNSTNPSYAELVEFILSDTTNLNPYILEGPDAYVCADYAEDVHNTAEANGIKTAWVGINFAGEEIGHALNAFVTTDKGLVYIDCTSGDTVAYIREGKEYGSIYIENAESLAYSYYEEYMQKWLEFDTRLEAYNNDVDAYNLEIEGKTYITGTPEEIRISAWAARLDKEMQELAELSEELGDISYETLGVVEKIFIHW